LATNQLGDALAARNLLREARNTARQQGFSGLEAEALFGEAVVTPPLREENRTIILSALRAAIAIASESGAKPLLQRAEAMLNGMLAAGDQLT
jgi:hypothetical protein